MNSGITLGMIVRNEGRTLEKCLESVAPYVDRIVIGLAGESTDNTKDVIGAWNGDGRVHREPLIETFDIEWTDDFSAARNKVMEKVESPYFLWLDGDDVLLGGEKIPAMIAQNPQVDGFYWGYDYARDEQGNNICYLVRERIVKMHPELPQGGWHWIGKVHEVLAPVAGWEPTHLHIGDIVVQHHKPADKHEPGRNLAILYEQLRAQEPNPDPRVLAYLCTENMARGNFDEAILHGQRFVPLSGWREERYQMQHRIADMYRVKGDFERALEADHKAIQITPEWPDAYLGLAETSAAMSNYVAAIEWTKAASTKNPPQTMLIIDPLDYSYKPYVVLAGAYAWTGAFEEAYANYAQAYAVYQEPLILKQLNAIREELELRKVVVAFKTIREHLARNDEWLKVRMLFDVTPKKVQQHPDIQEGWKRTALQTAHIERPQIMADFYTDNPHWAPMSDEQILSEGWLNYPRLQFAINTAKKIGAKNVVDWGCSDGFISLPLAREAGVHVTGFDLDPRCIELAQRRAKLWGLDARFEVGNIDEIGGWEGPKADLAVAFEVIEHTVDPAEFLSKIEMTANHVALTTPYLAWEGGNIPEWDKIEPKGHLRIFDQFDLEALITPRGRINNLYREPWGSTGWLFCDYTPGERHDKNIIIGALGAIENWNPRMLDAGGMGGSETAIVRLGEAFARRGHRPIVYTNTDEPGYYNGVCFRPAAHFQAGVGSDLFIAWRTPEYADHDLNTKCLVLWMHDTDCGDRLTVERARKFDAIVVLTEWHKQYMIKLYPFLDPANTPGNVDPFVVIGNGVDVTRFEGKVTRNPKRVIYSSSPDRGLDVILEHIWPKVIEAVPDAELHIYYGWNNIDQFAPAYPQLAAFRNKMMNLLATSKGVVQHGRVNQDELAKEFMKSSVWLYPTYFTETYCISAVEAQLAGALPITNRLAALNETVVSGINIVGDVRDEGVQEAYAKATIHVLTTPMKDQLKIRSQIKKASPAKSWDEIASLWSPFLKEN